MAWNGRLTGARGGRPWRLKGSGWTAAGVLMAIGIAGVLLTGRPARTEVPPTTKNAGGTAGPAVATLGDWKMTGGAAADSTHDRTTAGEGAEAIRVPPGGHLVWMPRKSNGAGEVKIWVFDDLTAASDTKARLVGPTWGLVDDKGQLLVVGVVYAPYLSGGDSYAICDVNGNNYFAGVQYSGLKRATGWHEWTFGFDPDTGLTILVDGTSKAKFDWRKTQMKGFAGVVVDGDTAQSGGQTVWISGATAELGAAVKTEAPQKAAAEAAAVPAGDPFVVPGADPVEAHPVELLPTVRDQHPRLLFGKDDVAKMRADISGPKREFYTQLLQYLPVCSPPGGDDYLTNATTAQQEGMWRMPTVALHYVLTHDRTSFQRACGYLTTMCRQESWEKGGEEDSGMGAANILVGVALTYDWLYNDLDPELRSTVRAKLLLQARKMYYYGHLQKRGNDYSHYWQQDTQNNHRWHRDAGLVLATMAVSDGEPDSRWLLARVKEEIDLVGKWLPPDGSSHESSSYQAFGMPYLGMTFDAADRCLAGETLADRPYFKNMPMFRLQTMVPGLTDSFSYGDSGGTGYLNNFCFKCTSVFHERNEQSGLIALYRARPAAFNYGWLSIIFFDLNAGGGSVDHLPLRQSYPDLGMSFFRDGWGPQNVGMMFKCCPYGGATLNAYRNTNKGHYVNVGHDDPDANMFVLYADRQFVADDDRYAKKKLSSSHNTILVDGHGQIGEGEGFTQPVAGDMTRMAYITGSQMDGPIAASEGEAAGAYKGLKRFRRGVYWAEGKYVLILDDIVADQDRDLTWLVQGPAVKEIAGPGVSVDGTGFDAGRYHLGSEPGGCDMSVFSDLQAQSMVATSTAEDHGKSMGYLQVQLKVHGIHWRVVSVFDPWRQHPAVTVGPGTGGASKAITIAVGGLTDQWNWGEPSGDHASSDVLCERGSKQVFRWGMGHTVPAQTGTP